jgi:hypothetical protein
MNSGGGQEGRGLVWLDRFFGRPDRQSSGGGSCPLALGSLTHASGRDIPNFVRGRVAPEPEAVGSLGPHP